MARITVLNLMALVVIVALGLASMRDASVLTEQVVYTVMLLVLTTALLGAIVSKGNPACVGFALFGWSYAALSFVPAAQVEFAPHVLTGQLVDAAVERLLQLPPNPSFPRELTSVPTSRLSPKDLARADAIASARDAYQVRLVVVGTSRVENSNRIGHCVLALVFGLLGAGLGRFLAARLARDRQQDRRFGPRAGHEFEAGETAG